ncbi:MULTISPECIES: glycosyltransferase family protein [Rikenellaceae]|uniref:Glycosyltransferase n=1 Tax=Alistipes inops TaxID=1501391 RepID=A0ABR4YI83_9BACT|nr:MULTISPECIES: hypothetical protein [Rikenellaceae]KHE41977.1 hypothetical protein LG35_06980 [Alistipes inops]
MERLSSAYAYLWETCGPWGIALLACMIILFFVQFWYWVGYYGRIPSYRNARAGDARPPVSVALVVHEPDYDFLENGLPVLLGQEYDDFEIIVTDLSGDVEFGEALAVIAEHNPRFNVTRMVRDARFPISDKMAFNVAIKAARYDNILLTTVDSRPASLQWIARMARGFDGAGIVIGYCGMEGASAFSSRLIRLDNAARAIRWLSAAMHGKPYRGTLQNIGFTKALYFGNGGFNYLNMNIGEDDLFIQKLLETGTAAAVIVSSNSTVRQKIWGGTGWWYADRCMRSNAFRHYPAKVKTFVAAELWSRALFFAAAAAAVVLFPPELKLFAAGLLLIRFGLIFFEMRRITRRLSEKGLMRAVPLYDLCSPLYEAWMAADRKFRRSPGLWR